MPNVVFEVLEKKVNEAVETINKLKKQNKDLEEQNNRLKNELEGKDKEIENLKFNNKRIQELETELNEHKEKERLVKEKVEALVTKLDNLEKASES
jgi:FtsZ-binding cell division protein ZapB